MAFSITVVSTITWVVDCSATAPDVVAGFVQQPLHPYFTDPLAPTDQRRLIDWQTVFEEGTAKTCKFYSAKIISRRGIRTVIYLKKLQRKIVVNGNGQ